MRNSLTADRKLQAKRRCLTVTPSQNLKAAGGTGNSTRGRSTLRPDSGDGEFANGLDVSQRTRHG